MDGHDCPGLDGIEHPLALVFRGVAEVEVLKKPGRGFGLGGQGVEDLAGNHILRIHRRVAAVFDFHDDGAGFEGVDGVPLAGGDVEGDVGADD